MRGGSYAMNYPMHQGLMGYGGGLIGFIGLLISIVILIDLILLGMLLWRKYKRDK